MNDCGFVFSDVESFASFLGGYSQWVPVSYFQTVPYPETTGTLYYQHHSKFSTRPTYILEAPLPFPIPFTYIRLYLYLFTSSFVVSVWKVPYRYPESSVPDPEPDPDPPGSEIINFGSGSGSGSSPFSHQT